MVTTYGRENGMGKTDLRLTDFDDPFNLISTWIELD